MREPKNRIIYQVNTTPVKRAWDVNRVYAVSNCSNTGKDILSAYYNGSRVVYKVSPNSMLYKTTGIENSSLENSEVKLFPNPASRDLYVVGTAGSNYEVVNVEGRVLQRGILSSKAIDISVLPAGFYTLRLMSTMKGLQTLKFTKQ